MRVNRIKTKYNHKYLLDYSYKMLKTPEFAQEKEVNFCTLMMWRNEERITPIRFLLVYESIFVGIGMKKKYVVFTYTNKPPRDWKKYLQILFPIGSLTAFLMFLHVMGKQMMGRMQYKYLPNTRVKTLIYLYAMSGYKIKVILSIRKPLFLNYICHYIDIYSLKEHEKYYYKHYGGTPKVTQKKYKKKPWL